MRKIIADVVTDPSELVTKPDGVQRRLKIVEPASGNIGPTQFQGAVKTRPRSMQELRVAISRAGDYASLTPDYGAQFIVEPDHLRDDTGAAVVDATNEVGVESFDIPHYHELLDGPQTSEVTSPKATALEHWGDMTAAGGVSGMCAHVLITGANFSILGYRLIEYDIHATNKSYVWTYFSQMVSGIGTQAFTNTPSIDLVELPDGSIVCMVAFDDKLQFWKTFDCGVSWHKASEVTVTSRRWYCSIERIGTRLVAAYSYQVVATSHTGYTITSDDGGVTWSSANTVYNIASSPQPDEFLDMAKGRNGKLYLVHPSGGGPVIYSSSDGANWTLLGTIFGAGVNDYSASLVQLNTGGWVIYVVYASGGGNYIKTYYTDNDEPRPGWTAGYRVSLDGDSDGLDNDEVCARSFFDGAFIDVFSRMSDDHSTAYYSIVTSRVGMWSGIEIVEQWEQAWGPIAYPSISDAHPNMNHWVRTQSGAAASALKQDEMGYLRFTTATVTADELYYSDGLPVESWESGIVCRFELKVVNGSAKVRVVLCADATAQPSSGKDVEFTIIFRDTGQIQLVDDNAVSILQTITPTNWDTLDWNEYIIVCQEDVVELYRAPSAHYREFVNYELVFSDDTLQIDNYAADNDQVDWGVINTGVGNESSTDVYFRNFMLVSDTGSTIPIGWNFATDPTGRRCVAEKSIGILQGISCKWGGNYAVDGDEWQLDVGAVYEVENIFVGRPSIRWQERDPSGASPATTIAWQRGLDANGNQLEYEFDAVAVFGKNWRSWTIYGESAGGGSPVDLGASGWEERLTYLDSVDKHIVAPHINSNALNYIPNQYASDGHRFWYLEYVGGALSGKTYKIIGNDETRLFLEEDVETLGSVSTDACRIFGDRGLCIFSSVQNYARIRVVISTITTSPSENGLRLGTVVFGRIHALPDDEWVSTIKYDVFMSRAVGRAGHDTVVQLGGRRRTVNLAYTGITDANMGREPVGEFLRHMRDGERPFVWVDDDSFEDVTNPQMHPEPILVRSVGGFSQTRKSYQYLKDHYGTTDEYYIRNVLDVGSVVFEEVL